MAYMESRASTAAKKRWADTPASKRKELTAAAAKASQHRNRAAHQVLRAAEDAITAAGGEVRWP